MSRLGGRWELNDKDYHGTSSCPIIPAGYPLSHLRCNMMQCSYNCCFVWHFRLRFWRPLCWRGTRLPLFFLRLAQWHLEGWYH